MKFLTSLEFNSKFEYVSTLSIFIQNLVGFLQWWELNPGPQTCKTNAVLHIYIPDTIKQFVMYYNIAFISQTYHMLLIWLVCFVVVPWIRAKVSHTEEACSPIESLHGPYFLFPFLL